jgi:DNA-binding beta-propeller fold protein YncE
VSERAKKLSFALASLISVWLSFGASFSAAEQADPEPPFYADYDIEEAPRVPPIRDYPPPGKGFSGPCGVAVDNQTGIFYVSDYYHRFVDAFAPSRDYLAHLPSDDPLNSPCGLVLDPQNGNLYVNYYHQGVARFAPSAFPTTKATSFGAKLTVDTGDSTGVALDPATGRVYVNDRTYVAVYEPSGAPVMVGTEPNKKPLRIGEGTGAGSLKNGFGVAVLGTKGWVFVPDAADRTVKVYDPEVDPETPIHTIDGHELPTGGFILLRDAAIAVDQETGLVYVSDDIQPEYFERPEAAIYAFDEIGVYTGRLRYNIVNARPPGLAVGSDNVYVTSGNGEGAFVSIYAAGAVGKGTALCAVGGACPPSPTAVLAPDQPAALGLPVQNSLPPPLAITVNSTAAVESAPIPRIDGQASESRRAECRRTKGRNAKRCRRPFRSRR